jgi:flavin-binding protein dodecin
MAHTYGISEVVGTSTSSIEDAITSAVARASTTVRGLDWFEVTEIRGHLQDGADRPLPGGSEARLPPRGVTRGSR